MGSDVIAMEISGEDQQDAAGTGMPHPADNETFWYLYDRQDRIFSQLKKRIERLEKHLAALEEKRRI